jgi:monomeric sarcosine oxidase
VNHYDVIVLGTGGVGTAALYQLAGRGVRAIGLDRFPPGHDRGSSHGETRLIRLAYFEDPNYVPLVQRALELWRSLEQEAQRRLYYETGILVGGLTDSVIIDGMLRASREHRLPLEQLSASEAMRQYPGYRLPADFVALVERRAGFLMVEDCVRAHAAAAMRAGAEVRSGVTVREWRMDGTSIVVTTDDGTLMADRLVVTAGAWAGEFLQSLGVKLRVVRKPLFWYRADEDIHRVEHGCPCFLLESLGGIFYGFPQVSAAGVKLGEHTGGNVVENPLEVDRTLRAADQRRVEECLAAHLPAVSRECIGHAVCMYTMSPDENFIVGRHPEHEQVMFTAGLSGHGFKFASVLGEIMADLALDGATRQPIGFLSPTRFGG